MADVNIRNSKTKRIIESLAHESDRGCAIFAAAYLDETLEKLLRSFMRDDRRIVDKLFRTYAPLSTFAARLEVAFALKLIPRDIRDPIDLIRRIRNDFAHESGPLTFQDPRVQDRLHALIRLRQISTVVEDVRTLNLADDVRWQSTSVPFERLVFVLGATKLLGHLDSLIEDVASGKDVRAIVRKVEEAGLE